MTLDAMLGRDDAVLVLDLDEDSKSQCLAEVRRLGFNSISAGDAREAHALLERGEAGVAVVDSGFPGTGELSFVDALARENPYGRGQGRGAPKVILTAARPSKELVLTALRASVVDLLEKPLVPDSLARALRRAMKGAPGGGASLSDRLLDLSRDLNRVAGLIEPRKAEPRAAPGTAATCPAPMSGLALEEPARPESPPMALPEYLRGLLRDAAIRRAIGGGELFGDPAWEMLLDLLLARFEDRKVSVTSACIASGAPMTTALRLVRRLVEQGVLVRYPDALDRRREFLTLHPSVAEALVDYVRGECPPGALTLQSPSR